MPEDKQPIPFPEEAAYLWTWFVEIWNATGGEVKPSEVEAYFRLRDITPEVWEVQTITDLYTIRMQADGDSKT